MNDEGSGGCGILALISGAAFMILAGVAYQWFVDYEAAGSPYREVLRPIAIAYQLGGKWLIIGILGGLSVLSFLFVMLPRLLFVLVFLIVGLGSGFAVYWYYPEIQLADTLTKPAEEFREFKSKDGKVITAKLVSFENGIVEVERKDGKRFRSKIEIYSPEDQLYIRRRR
ncbi:MAG: hypothetical protein AAGA58_14995 [Verrucomicrobiota bacterium]